MGSSLLLAVSGPTRQNVSIFDPVSPPAESIVHLSVLVLAIAGFIFLVVEGVLFYCVFRFRRRGQADETEPAQVYGSKPIEVAWTAAPGMIVFVLVLVTARTLWEVKVPPPAPGRATAPSSSRSWAVSGGGNTPTTTTTARRSASPRPTSCMCRPARTACLALST